MPGISEAKTTTENSESGNPVENASSSDEANIQSSSTENEQTPQESDQTDKINKFLLKSFLQRINNHPINMPTESVERNSDESDGDWNWLKCCPMNGF